MIPKTRTEYVADYLRDQILTGKIGANIPLRQDAIAKKLGVSRIPVREALLLLQSEGLVEFIPHRGAFTTEISSERIQELFHLRKMIESSVLRHAIPKMTEADFSAAEDKLARYDDILQKGIDIELWSDYNYEFHNLLYAPSGLTESLAIIELLNTKCSRYVKMHLLYTKRTEEAMQEHRLLLTLCQEGDIERATTLLEEHIETAAETTIHLFEASRI